MDKEEIVGLIAKEFDFSEEDIESSENLNDLGLGEDELMYLADRINDVAGDVDIGYEEAVTWKTVDDIVETVKNSEI